MEKGEIAGKKPKTAVLCICKQTKNPPYCDQQSNREEMISVPTSIHSLETIAQLIRR